jgi:ComF family protein
MNRVRAALIELLYPLPMRCALCGEGEPPASEILCPACLGKLSAGAPDRISSREAFSVSVAAHPYAGPAGALVRALKYRGMAALAAKMGDEICAALALFGVAPPERLCFVPMHRSRRKGRLFNQSELIARAVGANMGVRPEHLLKRVRSCHPQARLTSFEARVKNVEGAFRATKSLDGARVLIIDDVFTTGATVRECARALLKAGAREVVVAVYARGGGNVR